MNMFKPTIAKSVKEYLEAVPSERKDMVLHIHNLIQKTVPNLKAHFATNVIGYGSFEYQNYKKERLSWPVIALANQKQYISVYVCAVSEGGYIAEKYKDGTVSELDGLAVDYADWRFNIRSSNTEPLLRLNVEADNEQLMQQHFETLTQLIIESGASIKGSH